MPLSDLAVRKAKAAEKPYKMADGGGLHLYVSTAGGKLWRWRYERDGKEQLLSLGAYPDMTLAAARESRDAARLARSIMAEAICGFVAKPVPAGSLAIFHGPRRLARYTANGALHDPDAIERSAAQVRSAVGGLWTAGTRLRLALLRPQATAEEEADM